jgi:SAM-dependent methyltransferase
LNLLARSDRHVTWIHLGFLFVVTILPFSTRLLAEFITFRAALICYWSNIWVQARLDQPGKSAAVACMGRVRCSPAPRLLDVPEIWEYLRTMPAPKHLERLDSIEMESDIASILSQKAALRGIYLETYGKYREVLARCPPEGVALEIGSGAGFLREVLPEIVTSDVLPYAGIDQVVDARDMPFGDGKLRAVFMVNVLHHIPDCGAFFAQLVRCLKPGGRALLIDMHPGLICRFMMKFGIHEPYDPDTTEWAFDSSGPLTGANTALAHMIFQRDKKLFAERFPELGIVRYQPHTPLRYWLSGGLKSWSLLPGWAFPAATHFDRALAYVCPWLASFVDIELVRKP